VSPTRLFLLRHGESTWNTEGRWQGQADPPLTTLGERQAEAAAGGITVNVDAIWTSDLGRASRTAELLTAALCIGPPRNDARLRERDAGEWSGLTRAEIEERWPGHLAARRSPPGWEPDTAVVERALAALHDIADETPGGVTLVVTHGGVVRVVERHLGAEPGPLPNLGGRWIDAHGDAFVLGERQLLIDPDEVEVTVPPPH
jgi:broad specificity phosphatase PhoE